MKILNIAIIFLSLASLCACNEKKESTDGYFDIEIWQNNKEIPIVDKIAHLENKPFELKVIYNNEINLLFNANDEIKTYNQTNNNKSFNDVLGFSTTAMAEYADNRNNDIILSRKSPSLLLNKNTNKCNSTLFSDEQNVCVRVIERISYQHRKYYSIKEYPGKNIYLSFFSYSYDKATKKRSNFNRKAINLKFDPKFDDMTHSRHYNEMMQLVFNEYKDILYQAYKNHLLIEPDYTNKAVFKIILHSNGDVLEVTDHNISSVRDNYTKKIAELISNFNFNIVNTNNRNMIFYYPIDFLPKKK